jgi:hypothetical protein
VYKRQDSNLPRVLMVPQPVNQIELAKTAHFIHVKALRIDVLLKSCNEGCQAGTPCALLGLYRSSLTQKKTGIGRYPIPYGVRYFSAQIN